MAANAERLDIRIADGDERYFEELCELCDDRFGTGYVDRAVFERWMRYPRLLKIALVDGRFIGFAVMVPADTAEIMRKMKMPERDVLEIAGEKPALIYKSAAVRPEYEHCGVMHAMAAQGIEDAKELGYGALFAAAWVYGGKIPIEPTFNTFHFQRLYERKMLWYDDEEYRCVVCKGRCTCDAMIYYKKL